MGIGKELYISADGLSLARCLKITKDVLSSEYFGGYEILASKENCLRTEGNWFGNEDFIPPALRHVRSLAIKNFHPKILYSISQEIDDNVNTEGNMRLEFYLQGNYGHRLFVLGGKKSAENSLILPIDIKIEPSNEHSVLDYHKLTLLNIWDEADISIPEEFGINLGEFCHRFNGWRKKLKDSLVDLLNNNGVENGDIHLFRYAEKPVIQQKKVSFLQIRVDSFS